MTFQSGAIGQIALIPRVEVLHRRVGDVTLTPPAKGDNIATLHFENFTGILTIEMDWFFEAGTKKQLLVTSTIDSSDDEVQVVHPANNRNGSVNRTAAPRHGVSAASSACRSVARAPNHGNSNELASRSDAVEPNQYAALKLKELREVYKQRFGKYPKQGVMNKKDTVAALVANDKVKSSIGATSNVIDEDDSDDDDEDLNLNSHDDDEDLNLNSDDDNEDLNLNSGDDEESLDKEPPEMVDPEEDEPANEEDEPANPDGTEMYASDDDEVGIVEGDTPGNSSSTTNFNEMKVEDLKKYFIAKFGDTLPKRISKTALIALIKEKEGESIPNDDSARGGSSDKENQCNFRAKSTRKRGKR